MNFSDNMTLRELLNTCNLDVVYKHINDKDIGYPGEKKPSLSTTAKAYAAVVDELLSKPKVDPYSMSIMVEEATEYDGEVYADVSLLNNNYVEPKAGLKPWGGYGTNKTPPAGHYDCNLEKHNKRFAFGFVKWSSIIDTPVINNAKYSNERMLAEILWEMTFYGWTEDKVDDTMGIISKRLDEVEKGDFIEFTTTDDLIKKIKEKSSNKKKKASKKKNSKKK